MSAATESLAIDDLAKQLKREEAEEELRIQQLKETAKRAEQEQQLLQKHVTKLSNPSPLVVLICAGLIIGVVWLVYMYYIKPNISGYWISNDSNIYCIKHDPIQSSATINGHRMTIIDNYLKYNDVIGVWDYSNQIRWLNGQTFNRLRKN